MKESKHLETNKDYWDKCASSMDGKGLRYEFLRKCQTGVISLLEIEDSISVLDIGCGTGWALGQIAKKVNGKGSFYGVDLSSKMIENAQGNFKDDQQFHFVVANAESIPLNGNMFNIIICINSFHHYFNPQKAMNEMQRLLKNGGKLYILDPTADSRIFKILSKIMALFDHAHEKLYSTKEFKEMMLCSGLKYIGLRKIQMYQKVHIGEK